MLEIDGSMGEGGGQVLRSSLTLSSITGKAFRIKNIRKGRSKPGLRPQHLRAVEAVAEICRAKVTGAHIGATGLTFQPGKIFAGTYSFAIGTAGAISLILQTVFLPLATAGKNSLVKISGGSHVPWSPCFEYLNWHWLYFLGKMGLSADLIMERAGFYPKGGGIVRAEIKPFSKIKPIVLGKRGRLIKIRGFSAIANLPDHIARRQKNQALQRLSANYPVESIEISRLAAISPGTIILLLAEFEEGQACFFSLGERGKPAEKVADEAVDQLEEFLATGAAIDHYLADQLLLPLALADGVSVLNTSRISSHLLTNARVVQIFLPVEIKIRGEQGGAGQIEIGC